MRKSPENTNKKERELSVIELREFMVKGKAMPSRIAEQGKQG